MQLTKYQIDYCMECGVCTGSCPISQDRADFSPRRMIKRTLEESEASILQDSDLWACLSCSRCSDRCPVGIDFPEFIRRYRTKALTGTSRPRPSHHGIFQTLTNLQAGTLTQNRTGWAAGAGTTREKGDYFYFVGCLPYQEVVFRYLDLSVIDIAKSSLRLLNQVGIEPVVSNEERCCGHDAYWSGNEELFDRLARKNVETIVASGAKTVVFSCPEGYSTFREHYPEVVGSLPFSVIHLTELLADRLDQREFEFSGADGQTVAFHDPCRLGRRSGIYEKPRRLLEMVPKSTLTEMENNRENAVCCGTTAWMECSSCSRAMQLSRLLEAQRAGAETIVTACPKCQIHLTCAKANSDLQVEIKDLYSYLADRLPTPGPEAG